MRLIVDELSQICGGLSAEPSRAPGVWGCPSRWASLIARGWNYQGLEGFAVRTTFRSKN